MQTSLQDLLKSGGPIVADGAMGTMLFELGLTQGDSPELWNVEYPDRIRSVHRQYIEAGSQIVLTNTFGGNRLRLDLHKLADRAAELNEAGAHLARAEADATDRAVVVGGSIGPTGSILVPYGDLEFGAAVEAFQNQAQALVSGGVDVLWIETMSDTKELRAAVEACQQGAPGFPLVATMTFDTHGHTMMGVTPETALEMINGLGVVALGGNCGNGPDEIEDVIRKMRETNPDVILVAKANAGIPHLENGAAVYDGTPEVMADYAVRVHHLGATVIGACCGSTPDHIRAMVRALGQT